ncbi:hypothetical protein HCH_06384 [Hahella chejuensis KCTC 2396]|uniref:Uncharacterized protein n=1 Tax=Hahella chejuensis (strain KCTC 2396) TaxID=349521 RepID=Q2S8J4_HAHCH|nr:hypothetical protein [Hahella chejuensis]ABC33030.1 hypothetical protein HCH_06384 [Hahella chejuensis KCTC 2396]
MRSHDSFTGQGIAFAILLFVLLFSVPIYIIFCLSYGSFWPHMWAEQDGYWFFLVIGGFFQTSIINYLHASKRIDVDKIMEEIFYMDEYKQKKPADAILAHYTDMASAALILVIVVISIKPLVSVVSIYIVAPILSFLVFTIFGMYGVLLMKALCRFDKSSIYIKVPLFMLILLIDLQGFKLFISRKIKIF